MKPNKVFNRYDIRGKYPEEIDEEFAFRLGQALGTFISNNYGSQVIVGKDNKKSSKLLKRDLVEGITSTGIDVLDIGTGPTDFTAFTAKENSCVGVHITSSHMPLDFNGFKFVYPRGNSFVNKDLYKLQDLFREKNFDDGEGKVSDIALDARKDYREALLSSARNYGVNWDKKIVVDTLGGSAKFFLPELLEELGAEVVDLSEKKGYKGVYRDPPNPKPDRLSELEQMVKQEDADLGLAFDLDADRITLYQDGFIDGDDVFSLLAQLVDGEVVASIDTSERIEDFVENIHYTRVGDPFVLDRSIEENVPLSGEPNGHYAFTEFVPYNSGILSGLILAGVNIGERIKDIPEYTVLREDIEVEDSEEIMEKLEQKIKQEYTIVGRIDGIKTYINGVKVLIRQSGTSPVIRVLADGKDKSEVKQTADTVSEIVRNS